MDVVVDGKQCSADVVDVAHQLKATHYPAFELHGYSTTITLGDTRPLAVPPPPPAP